ncbi:MAG: hypothetical protein R2706_01710 [Acidimicrobiales bacterium]
MTTTGGLVAGLVPVAVLGVVLGVLIYFGPDAPVAKAVSEGGTGAPPPSRIQLGVVALFFLLSVGVEVGIGGWVFSFAKDAGADAALVTTGFWSAFTLCRLIVVLIGHRATPARILYTSGGVAALGGVLLVMADRNTSLLLCGVTMIGAGIAPQFPTLLLFAERRIEASGSSMSVILAAAGVGGAGLPWLMGQIIELQGTDILPWLGLVGAVGTLAWMFVVAVVLPPPVR